LRRGACSLGNSAAPEGPAGWRPAQQEDTTMAIVINGNWWDDYLNADPGNNVEFDPEYHIFGREGDDEIHGGGNSDYIDGGIDADDMHGGAGSDTYVVDNTGDRVFEIERDGWLLNGGSNDQVNTTISFVLPELVEHLVLLESGGAIDGFGNNLENELWGNGSGNTLDGRDNNDELFGLAGADTLVGGRGDDKLYGGLHNDDLDGGEGHDRLDGQGGADTMSGGTGDDTYFVDNVGDEVEELAQQGNDIVFSSVSFDLNGAAVEDLTLQTGALNGVGNSLDNTITGNDAGNELYGNFGEDTLKGGGGDDELRGGTQNDILKGGGGDDELRGEAGDDQMAGHDGSDWYFVDSLGDEVFEDGPAEDIDSLSTMIDLTLPDNVERLFLQIPALNGTGNDLDNLIRGNEFNNTLDGGIGADTLIGFFGDDTYLVDNIDDVVTEVFGQGTVDTVKTSVSYRLGIGSDVEQLAAADALSTATMDFVGNEIRNTIRGNDGRNMIDGGGDADVMIGRKGNDFYIVNHVDDRINELANEGTDQVNSSVSITLSANVENVTLVNASNINATGNTLDNELVGNSGRNTLDGGVGADTLRGNGDNDTLVGRGGDDTLFGGTGADTLNGGTKTVNFDILNGEAGADTFVFASAEECGLSRAFADQLSDFSAAGDGDRIDLSPMAAKSGLVLDFIGNDNAFTGVAGQVRYVTKGYVEGDLNGDAVADFFIAINVTNNPTLTDAAFIL
jgi:Ca2+-binding RTX toxin-like protein